jgi:PIN domain nuclease of toxin-antitoxin system
MLNLDTHVLLSALTDQLTAAERRILAREPWSISAIVLWEIANLAQLGWIETAIARYQEALAAIPGAKRVVTANEDLRAG